MKKELFLELLKDMPTGLTSKLKIGENEMACKKLKCTMDAIKLHNATAEGFDEGYKQAIEDIKKWRKEITNKIIYEEQ